MMVEAWSFAHDQDAVPRLRRLCGGNEMRLGIYYEMHVLTDDDDVGKLCVYSSDQATKRRLFVVACTSDLHLQYQCTHWLQWGGERFSKLPEDRITHLFVCQMALAYWEQAIDAEEARCNELAVQRTYWELTGIINVRSAGEVEQLRHSRTEAIRRVIACLEQNRKTVEWIYLRIAEEHDHTVAEKLGYTEILDEYDSLIEKAEYIRQRSHMNDRKVSKANLVRSNFICELMTD